MVNELEQFQQDLLDSVRQMKAGKAARVTEVPLSAAAEARDKVAGSRQVRHRHFYVLLASIRKRCGICGQPEVKSSTDCSD